ncbi:MAG: DUF47 family protein [Verrucomicrobia bacterium]|nr:DUF47 family protein [Verrucomicrobiota bacterium]
MFSLQRLLGKEDKFFDLLEASAQQAQASVQALIQFTKSASQPGTLDAFIQSRRKDKRITAEISEALCTTFITALEREDIEALSNALYKIPKTVEKIGERMLIAPQHLRADDFSKHAPLMQEATETVVAMIKGLRRGLNLEQVKDQNDLLQRVEGEADKLILELYKDLYSGKHDPLKVIILKDLYELLEKVVDRCRDAGNVISQIVMKNS